MKETLHIYTRVSTSNQLDGTSLGIQKEKGIKLSKTEFDRDKLMDRLEGWMTELIVKSKG